MIISRYQFPVSHKGRQAVVKGQGDWESHPLAAVFRLNSHTEPTSFSVNKMSDDMQIENKKELYKDVVQS